MVKPKRLTSLEPKGKEPVEDLEESILRARHGIGVKDDGLLRVKTTDPALYEELLKMELEAFEKSGRMDELLQAADLLDVKTDNKQLQDIIRKLKRQ